MTAPDVAPQPGCPFLYSWSFGDGASASGYVVTHQYQKKGTAQNKSYTVTVAISTAGVVLTETRTKDVVVNP
jgi:chitodextrinase